MNKQTDSFLNQHPSAAEFDKLRSGLLDSDPTRRTAVLAHVNACATCQQQEALWPRLLHALDQQAADRGIAGALAARRHKALRSARRARPRPAYLGLAIAATITAIAIGIGTLFLNDTKDPTSVVAAVESPAPDLYADLDFYLWLMHKRTNDNASPNS